jgi:hypothetical protein
LISSFFYQLYTRGQDVLIIKLFISFVHNHELLANSGYWLLTISAGYNICILSEANDYSGGITTTFYSYTSFLLLEAIDGSYDIAFYTRTSDCSILTNSLFLKD